MATIASRYKGVTPPISTTLPTTAELKANDDLVEELKNQNNFEGSEVTERRKKTLQLLQKITLEFVKVVLTKKNKPQSFINAAGGKIFTFGSYRLGVYGPGSDIDTLVVVPKDVYREDFFEHFPPLLEKMAPPGAIVEMTPVPDAFVPIITLELSGIEIDLIFARLAVSSIPLNLDLRDNNLLRGLDERELRSVNGTRVTDELLDLVPQPKTFRTALRAVKLWAQRRAVYGNMMAFPGGVAWAMLVARVCQLYPQATGSVIVGKFFRIMSKWAWPQPVVLKEIENGPLQVRIWNPKIYPGDRYHLMPIITPAYPSMCATHNITLSTKKIISRELERGGDIVDKIFTHQLEWKDLFSRHTFFTKGYKYYLGINSASSSKEAQLLWQGCVGSKVRHLVGQLESDELIDIAHPFNKGFDRVHRVRNQNERNAVLSGSLQFQATDVATETTDVGKDPKQLAGAEDSSENVAVPNHNNNAADGDGVSTIYTTTYYIGIELAQGRLSSIAAHQGLATDETIVQVKKLDISRESKSWMESCYQWPGYKEDVNYLTVAHTRNYDLPADVFGPDEVRPSRPNKKRTSKTNAALKDDVSTNRKRKIGSSESEYFTQGTWENSDDGFVRDNYWPWSTSGHLADPTNVTRFCRALMSHSPHKDIQQIVYYQAGLGSANNWYDQIIGGATGNGISELVREAYGFLCLNYAPGDEIFLVGFSRGAFTARTISGLIADLGLLTRTGMMSFYPIFKDWENQVKKEYVSPWPNLPFPKKPPFHDPHYTKELERLDMTRLRIPIKAVGVWDTVGSLGIPDIGLWPKGPSEYAFINTVVSPNVENAFHALALDEHRKPFSPTIWEKPEGQQLPNKLVQCWFPGVHANVGGGYPDTATADITLAWMMSQLDEFLDFDPEYIVWQRELNVKYYQDEKPPAAVRPWAMGEVYHTYKGIAYLGGSQTRTPGQYHPTDGVTGDPKPRYLRDTREHIHPSVRVRLACGGKGAEDQGFYTPEALKKFKLLAPGEVTDKTAAVQDPYEHRYRWVLRSRDRVVILPESELGDVELKLLRMSPEAEKMVEHA
ncbi:polynucleotide adenylyltransferase [Xylographa opegraphella]|nr:polynucleotide adenylyltransferase [Xylographa opegraphella]